MRKLLRYFILILSLGTVIASAGAMGYFYFTREMNSLSIQANAPVKMLEVPLLEQPYQYACNVTAAAMALQFKGVKVSPDQIYDAIPKQEIKHEKGYWGNPNIGFVGNVYGEYGGDKSEGYGLHWKPVAEFMKKHRDIEVKQNWNVTEMLSEIDKGNPSIVWVQNNFDVPRQLSWKSYDENRNIVEITGVLGMHSEVLIGYKGTLDSPSELIFNDPWNERWDHKSHSYTVKEFERLWAFYNETAIVVR
jgi:uncharacterized protein YvpB